MAMDGILNINKPTGITSFGVVAIVKRLCGEKRVGHAGTLDPAATGVLPVCIGQGTRVIEFLMDTTKAYRAEIELGVSTDTYDAEGKVTAQGDASSVTRAQLDVALASFYGEIQQVPPMYSALKHEGRPLYDLAREGAEVELKSRAVTIHKLELIDFQPCSVTIEVVCSKGTYIRSIAHDLGRMLGCGAHLKSLIRTRCGIFDIKDSVSVPRLEEAFKAGTWQQLLYPIDSVLGDLPSVVVSDEKTRDIKNGKPLVLENTPGEKLERRRAYTTDGRFIGVLRFSPEEQTWHPEKVFLGSGPVLKQV